MTDRARLRLVAALAGLLVATIVVVAGFWIGGAFDDSNRTDGSFVLDEPGVFDQPLGDINDDSSGDRLPELTLTDADGGEHPLGELAGAPAVLNFWFSSCVPCRRELADFATVEQEVGDEVRFIGVNPFDQVEPMEDFAAARGVAYELWRDDGSLIDELGIVGFPVTLFVAPDGTVLRQTGEIDADALRATLDELFGVA
jgi:thiol-disulfide isomerase/thioredoxin